MFFYSVPDRLTTVNQILLTVGVVLLCVAIANEVILLMLGKQIKGEISLHLIQDLGVWQNCD